ncbi:MAG: sigma-E processing peptidase SpoIIGA [Eubacteriales bacterium]
MQYHIYIDTLLFMNFIMDFLALELTNQWRKRNVKCSAIVRAALFGAITTSALMLIGNLNGYMKLIILYLILIPIMNGIAFSSKRIEEMVINSGCTIIMMILLTGVLNVCYTHVPFLEKFQLPLAIMILLAYGIYRGISYTILVYERKKECVTFLVSLRNGEKNLEVVGLMDTGNSLIDPISKKPVCMIDGNLIEGREVNGVIKGFCVIPFHSVGKKHGVLEGFEVDEVTILYNGVSVVHKDVLVAVAPNDITSNGAYQMILHPQLLK